MTVRHAGTAFLFAASLPVPGGGLAQSVTHDEVPVLISVSPGAHYAVVPVGSIQAPDDSVRVFITPPTAGASPWAVTKNASWTVLLTIAGTGNGVLRWTRNPTGLAVGLHVDTITIRITNNRTSVTTIIDTLRITIVPPAAGPAAEDLMGSPRLTIEERLYLDEFGNRDGVYNLGDFVALLLRTRTAPQPRVYAGPRRPGARR